MIDGFEHAEAFDKLTARARRLGWALQESCRGGYLLEQHPRQIFCGDAHQLTKVLIGLARAKRELSASMTDKPFFHP